MSENFCVDKMKYTIEQVVQKMKDTGLIPLFSHSDVSVMRAVIEAYYKAGIRTFEFTNRQKNSLEMFRELVDFTSEFKDFMFGVGTIMDTSSARQFIEAGASFIVAPVVQPEVGELCRRNDMAWIPGCQTVTEIVLARDHGAAMVKLFPASVLGPGFVSAIRPVLPDIPLMITGGVEPTEESMRSWFNVGATCVGLGSNLLPKTVLENKDWNTLEAKAREAVSIVQKIKSSK
jgi:2-dehydro-3-deoxyphosphogluconate aldolase / (4S)-4-hydroxy-2-oxoglutarate aldolase